MPEKRTLISQDIKTKQENKKTIAPIEDSPGTTGKQARESPYFNTCNNLQAAGFLKCIYISAVWKFKVFHQHKSIMATQFSKTSHKHWFSTMWMNTV